MNRADNKHAANGAGPAGQRAGARMTASPVLGRAELEALADIARSELNFQTLETRNSDRLDFQEVSVWGVRQALARAFLVGLAKGQAHAGKPFSHSVETP